MKLIYRKKKLLGLSTIEVLVSFTILIVLMTGINAILVAKSGFTNKHNDIITATNLAQKVLNNIRENSSSDIDFYLSLNGQKKAPLTEYPFKINDIDPKVKNKFIGVLSVRSGEALTTKSTNPGNNITIFIDKMPTKIGLFSGKYATIYNRNNGISENIFVKKVNDLSRMVQVDNSSSSQGRVGISNNYPVGSILIGDDKAVKIEIFYNKSTLSKPLITIDTVLNFPFGDN